MCVMTTKDKVKIVKQLVSAWKSLEKNIDKVDGAIGIDIESPFMDVIYRSFDNYIESVAMLVGDESEWLKWYIFENDCGNNRLEAQVSIDNEEPIYKAITKVKHLVRVIEG